MIKKLIILFLLFISVGLISINRERLQEVITECPYETSEYVKGKFDCSNMVAMLGDWLKEHNYRLEYCCGEYDGTGHVWLVVEDNIYVESTFKFIVDKRTYKEFVNIICADDYRKLSASSDEWIYPKERFKEEINE